VRAVAVARTDWRGFTKCLCVIVMFNCESSVRG
jgi:hypothetical protein